MTGTKRILVLLDNSYMPDNRVENEINVLLNEGYHIDMFCIEHDRLPAVERLGNLNIYREIPAIFYNPFSFEYKKYTRDLINRVSQSNYDILHCHDFRMFFLGCEIKKKIPEIPLIYDSHEYLAGYPYYRRSKKLSDRLKGFVIWNYYFLKEKKNLYKANKIITVSNALKDLLIKKSGRPGIVLRNLPPLTERCQTNCDYWHRNFNVSSDKKIIIHTGNAHFSTKRQLFLLECIHEDPRLAMVFLGSNNSLEDIKLTVAKRNFKDIFFHEQVKRSEITYYCSQADIGLVYTWNKKWKSYWNALPNKMMDVSLAGIPVLSTEQPELKNFINEFHHGITFNGDSKSSLKEGIEKLLHDYEPLKRNAVLIEKQLNWQLESQKLITLYNEFFKS